MKLMANCSYMFALMIVLNLISTARVLSVESSDKSNLQSKLFSKLKSNGKVKKMQINKYYPKSELKDIRDSYSENFPKEKIETNEKIENFVSEKTGVSNTKDPNLERKNLIDALSHTLNSFEDGKQLKPLENVSVNLSKSISTKGFDIEQLEGKFNNFKEAESELKEKKNSDVKSDFHKNKDNDKKDYQLNIYNNFLITNSTITQMLDSFLSSKKTLPQSSGINSLSADEILFTKNDWNSVENLKKEYSEKLKVLRVQEESESKSIKDKYTKMLKDLEAKNSNNLESIKEYKEKLQKLGEEKEAEKENLKNTYQQRINELQSKNKLTLEELQKKEMELALLKKQNENEYLLLKNKEQQIKDLKELISRNKIKRKALEENEKLLQDENFKGESQNDKINHNNKHHPNQKIKQDSLTKSISNRVSQRDVDIFNSTFSDNDNKLVKVNKTFKNATNTNITIASASSNVLGVNNKTKDNSKEPSIVRAKDSNHTNKLNINLKVNLNNKTNLIVINATENKNITKQNPIEIIDKQTVNVTKGVIRVIPANHSTINNQNKTIKKINKTEKIEIKSREELLESQDAKAKISKLTHRFSSEENQNKHLSEKTETLRNEKNNENKLNEVNSNNKDNNNNNNNKNRIKTKPDLKKKKEDSEAIRTDNTNATKAKLEAKIDDENEGNLFEKAAGESPKKAQKEIDRKIEFAEKVLTSKVQIKIGEAASSEDKSNLEAKMQKPKFFTEEANLIKKQIESVEKKEKEAPQSIRNLATAASGNIAIGNNDYLLYKKLNCMDRMHVDSKHFLLSNQKCKQLSYMFNILRGGFHIIEQKIGDFACPSHNCNFDLVINLNDDNAIFVIYKRKIKIMQSLFNPSIFQIKKFQLNQLRPDLLRDLISVYLYPSIARLFGFLQQETFNSFSVYIESNVFNGYDKVLKSRILEAILTLNKIDNRIRIDYNMIDYNSSPQSNNALFFNQNADKSAINLREGYHPQVNNNNKLDSMQLNPEDINSFNNQVFMEGKFNNNNNNINKYSYPNANGFPHNSDNYYSNPTEDSDFQGLQGNSDINGLLAKGENLNKYFYQNNFSNDNLNNNNKPQNNLRKNLRNNGLQNNLISDKGIYNSNLNKIKYPYQVQNYIYNSYPDLNYNYNDNNNVDGNLGDLKSSLENRGQYGESLAKGFFDENHLNFFSGIRFKQKNKEGDKSNEKNKEKEKDNDREKEKEKDKDKEKSRKQILKEKIKASLQDKKIRNHPCFNKGYFNKDLNFSGTGNFTDCYKFIGKLIIKEDLEKASAKINKITRNLLSGKSRNNTVTLTGNTKNNFTLRLNQFNSTNDAGENYNEKNNDFIYLDNQFKNFKFLFYERNGTDSVLVFKDKMQFGVLKLKVKEICEEQYSDVIADLTKFNIKNLANLCFDLTYLIKLLDKAKITNEKILQMKTHLNILSFPLPEQRETQSPSLILNQIASPFQKLFDSSRARTLSFLMLLITLALFVLNKYSIQISCFLLDKISGGAHDQRIENNLTFNEFTINKFMNFENVKAHLFYKEDSYFKQKYGSDFNPEYYDMVLLKHEVLEILRKDSDPMLKKIIVEKIKNLNQLRIIYVLKLIWIALSIGLFVCAVLLFNVLNAQLGVFKSLLALSLPTVFVYGLMLGLWLVLNATGLKTQGETEVNLKHEGEGASENEGLVVLAKQTLR